MLLLSDQSRRVDKATSLGAHANLRPLIEAWFEDERAGFVIDDVGNDRICVRHASDAIPT